MLRDRTAGALAVLLFLLAEAPVGCSHCANAAAASGGLLGFAVRAWDAGVQQRANFKWPNVMWAYLEPQRATL